MSEDPNAAARGLAFDSVVESFKGNAPPQEADGGFEDPSYYDGEEFESPEGYEEPDQFDEFGEFIPEGHPDYAAQERARVAGEILGGLEGQSDAMVAHDEVAVLFDSLADQAAARVGLSAGPNDPNVEANRELITEVAGDVFDRYLIEARQQGYSGEEINAGAPQLIEQAYAEAAQEVLLAHQKASCVQGFVRNLPGHVRDAHERAMRGQG